MIEGSGHYRKSVGIFRDANPKDECRKNSRPRQNTFIPLQWLWAANTEKGGQEFFFLNRFKRQGVLFTIIDGISDRLAKPCVN
jgi:hypothetical protein